MGGGDAPCGTAGKGRAAATLPAQPGSAGPRPVDAPESESGGLWPLRLLRAPGGAAGVRGCCRPTRDLELGMPPGRARRGQTGRPGPLARERKKSGMERERGLSKIAVTCFLAVIVLLK